MDGGRLPRKSVTIPRGVRYCPVPLAAEITELSEERRRLRFLS
jgi:hypothetical protein